MNDEAITNQIKQVFRLIPRSRWTRLWPVALFVGLLTVSVLTVFALAPTFTSDPVTTAVSGQPYSYDADAAGDPPPTYTLTTFPTDMTIDENTGQINWTAGTSGDYNVSVVAQNVDGTDTQNYVLTVGTIPLITSTPITNAIVGQAYTYDVDATGSPVPTYTLTTAPAGMSINETTGVITWTPSATGDFDVVVAAVNVIGTDAQTYTISVASVPVITSVAVTEAVSGTLYYYPVQVTGVPAPTFTLSVRPTGMQINVNTGLISWLPSSGGDFNVVVRATNTAGFDTQSYTLHVAVPPSITSTPVTNGSVGTPYAYTVTAVGDTPITYTLATAPAGMTINETTGEIAWTPTEAQTGVNPVSVQAVNAAGVATQDFEVVVPSTAVCLYDPISYWPLDEVTNDVSPDVVWSNDGLCSGVTCPGTAVAPSGAALDFDGDIDGLDVSNPASLNWDNSDSFTIQVWVNSTQTCDVNKVIVGSFRSSSSEGDWWLGCGNANNEAAFFLREAGTGGQAVSLRGTQSINDGQWHQITAVRDAAAGQTRLYVDGILEASVTPAYTNTFANSSPLHIGYYGPGHPFDYYFDGLIDELIIYNRALSVTEIRQHYTNTQAGVGYCAATAVTPNIISTPALEAPGGGQYTYQAQATGIPAPTFALGGTPQTGMQIDATTGLLTWAVDENLAGTPVEIRVQASNSGGTDEQIFSVDVLTTFFNYLPLIEK